jgi:hypothetical protein
MPEIRTVVRNAAAGDYRFRRLLMGIIQSKPFRMTNTATPTDAK